MGGDIAHTEHRLRGYRRGDGREDVLGQLGEDCECVGLLWDLWVEFTCACDDAGAVWALGVQDIGFIELLCGFFPVRRSDVGGVLPCPCLSTQGGEQWPLAFLRIKYFIFQVSIQRVFIRF